MKTLLIALGVFITIPMIAWDIAYLWYKMIKDLKADGFYDWLRKQYLDNRKK